MDDQSSQHHSYVQSERNKALRYDAALHTWIFQEGVRLVMHHYRRVWYRLVLRVVRYLRTLRAAQLRPQRSKASAAQRNKIFDWVFHLPRILSDAPTFTYAMIKAAQPLAALAHLPHADQVWHKRCVLHIHTLMQQGHDMRQPDAVRLLREHLLYDLDWNLYHGLMPRAKYDAEKQDTLQYLTVWQRELAPAARAQQTPRLTPRERVLEQVRQAQAGNGPAFTVDARDRPVMAPDLQKGIAVAAFVRAAILNSPEPAVAAHTASPHAVASGVLSSNNPVAASAPKSHSMLSQMSSSMRSAAAQAVSFAELSPHRLALTPATLKPVSAHEFAKPVTSSMSPSAPVANDVNAAPVFAKPNQGPLGRFGLFRPPSARHGQGAAPSQAAHRHQQPRV